MVDVGSVRGRERHPALAEIPGGDDEVRLAGRDEVRDRRLERARSGSCKEEDVLLGPADLAEARQAALVDRAKVGAAVMNDRLGKRCEHLRRHGRRPGREQVLLSSHFSQASGASGRP
jgi:hypothetical protein